MTTTKDLSGVEAWHFLRKDGRLSRPPHTKVEPGQTLRLPDEPEPQSDVIDTGDVVRHGPTGEEWVVAYVDGDHLSWVGWPPGMAAVADCTLVRKATPEERVKLLRQLANSQHHGRARASEALRHEQQPEPQSPEPDPDPDEVRRALDGYHGVHVPECVLAAARAWLRTRDLPGLAPNRVAFWDAVNQYAKACGGDTGSGTVSGARMDAVVAVERAVSFTRDTREQKLTIEKVIEACDGAYGYEAGRHQFIIEPEGEGYREAPIVKYGDAVFGCADTVAGSLRKIYEQAIAKIRESHAADRDRLKALGVES